MNSFGRPGENATDEQKRNYSSHMKNLIVEEQQSIDLVLIDGRFRAACCLKCVEIISPICLIAFDDFFDRPHYHEVLDYFDVVDKTTDERMAILKKKKENVSAPLELIQKYELTLR